MTHTEFYLNYVQIKKDVPSYRLGQHFINLFIKDESDPVLNGLWNKSEKEAADQIKKVIDKYQWSELDLPLIER